MTSKEQINEFLEGLELFGVRVYPMMGDYVVYFGEKPVGCVCDNRLFVKETPVSRTLFGDCPMLPPYMGAKPRYLVEHYDKAELAEKLFKVAEQLPLPKKRK